MPIFQQLACSLTRLHRRTSWGPLLRWASPSPSQMYLPTSVSRTFPSQGSLLARTRLFWASRLRGQALSLPASGAPTLAQSRGLHPAHSIAMLKTPRSPHQPRCGNPGPQRRSVLRHRGHALPTIRRGMDKRYMSRCHPLAGPAPHQHPKPWAQVRSPCSASGSKSQGRCTHSRPTETSLQVTKPKEQPAVCSSSAHARGGADTVTEPCRSAPNGGWRHPASWSGRRPSVWVRGRLGSPHVSQEQETSHC